MGMSQETHWVEDGSAKVADQWRALHATCGLYDASSRSRLCLLGGDRASFLHGQVTQEIQKLDSGEGIYAALADLKGRFVSDLNVYCLPDEILLDFEPNHFDKVRERLETYIVSEDVCLVDPSEHYTMLSLQGPLSEKGLSHCFDLLVPPTRPGQLVSFTHPEIEEEIYVSCRPRCPGHGFDLFVPRPHHQHVWESLLQATESIQGMAVGEVAMEMVRIEAGIPRSGFELTNAILVQESGLEDQMISFHKGCYIGQEVISRIKSVGKLNRQLCRFRLAGKPDPKPDQPVALMAGDQACGWLTSLAVLPSPDTSILAMGYVQTSILNQSLPIHVSGADGSSLVADLDGPVNAYGA